MGVKKLRSVFMRYIFTVAGGILFIIAVNVGLYMLFIHTEVIITAMILRIVLMTQQKKYRQINYLIQPTFPAFAIMAFILPQVRSSTVLYQKIPPTPFGRKLS